MIETTEGQRMTCQLCGRAILAKTGHIAHHGYQRPAQFWQTASCGGAKQLPFEVSRDRLGQHIEAMQDQHTRRADYLAKVKAEAVPAVFHYSIRPRGYAARRVDHSVDVTRDTWDIVQPAYANELRTASKYRFDDVHKSMVSSLTHDLESLATYIKHQRKRFDAWKHTHNYDDAAKTWVAA